MSIEFRCRACGQRLRVADEYRGQRARCSSCATILDVPDDVSAKIWTADSADVIDYELFGDENQYVEITLDPGEVAISRPEHMIYMASTIRMREVDKPLEEADGSLLEMVAQASKRILTRDRTSLHAFGNLGKRREIVAFAPTMPSRLIPMQLGELGGRILCKSASVLCVARGTEIRDAADTELAGRLLLQRLVGEGVAVLMFPGGAIHRSLTADRRLHVRSDALVAMTEDVRLSPHAVQGQNGEPSSLTLSGPGEVWLRTST